MRTRVDPFPAEVVPLDPAPKGTEIERGASGPGDGPLFRDVDADDADRLVAMMDATDRWPAVRAARAWVLEQAALRAGSIVVDVGCGPGTFTEAARAVGARTIDLDRSAAMVAEARRRRNAASVVRADVTALPIGDRVTDLVHVERVLQWCDEPDGALAELRRVVRPGGLVAVTDTDWSTLVVASEDPTVTARLAAAALRWVPHPTLAPSIPRRLRTAGATVAERTDVVTIDGWDPDDPAQLDGPSGLPIRTIVAAVPLDQRDVIAADVEAVATAAREGRFTAELTLVTAVARF